MKARGRRRGGGGAGSAAAVRCPVHVDVEVRMATKIGFYLAGAGDQRINVLPGRQACGPPVPVPPVDLLPVDLATRLHVVR